EIVRNGRDALLICYGPMVQYGIEVHERLHEEHGISTTVINARFAKPLDEELLAAEIPNYPIVCTLEDHALEGGFGSAVLECIARQDLKFQGVIERFGMQDRFSPHASQAEQHAMNGYSPS